MAEGGEDIDLVEDIIITPFSRRTFQEKLDIVRRGRPTPQSLSQAGKGFVRSPLSKFQLRALSMAQRLREALQTVLLGMPIICKWSIWCLEPHWLCKLELSNQGSNETPKYGWALTSNGAFENFWGHRSGSTAQRTSAQGNGAAQWKGEGKYWKDSLIVSCFWVNTVYPKMSICQFQGDATPGYTAFLSKCIVSRAMAS